MEYKYLKTTNEDNMRICIVPTMFPKFIGDYYGSFVYDEAKALVQMGFEVHVVTPHNQGAVYRENMEGIEVHRFRWMEPKPFRALVHFKGFLDTFRMLTYSVSLFFNLIRTTKKYKIQILHAHSVIPTGYIGSLISKLMGIPLFITAHGMDINNFEDRRLFNYFISSSLNSSHKSIAVSEDLAKKMRLLVNDENKVIVLRNGVDTHIFHPGENKKLRYKFGIKDDEILILFVGYLDTFKGIYELINSFQEISAENKNVKLLMVGGGPKKEDLLDNVIKMNLEDNVIFTGMIEHQKIHKYYQAADIFVLPSYTEGLPISVLEAMACGLPVVATNVGGIPEVITDGLGGFLVSPKSEKELIKKLNIILTNKYIRMQFVQKSLERIEDEFDFYKKIKKLASSYESFE